MGSPSEEDQSSTRYLETTRGTLSYSDVADIVAGHLADLLDRIATGEYENLPLDTELVRRFHREILEPIVPAIAGKWRPVDVAVGKHVPPRYYQVPTLMSAYVANVESQITNCSGDIERQVEALAYAEGGMLHIHPFEDFNGRAVRAFLTELLNRLDMPPIEVSVVRGTDHFERYKRALREFDMQNHVPMREFWMERIDLDLASHASEY